MSGFALPPWFALPQDALGWTWVAMGFAAGLAFVGVPLVFRLRKVSRQRHQAETRALSLNQELDKANLTLNEALAAIENENFTDPLTELRNRRYLSAVIKADVSKVQRAYREASAVPAPNQDLVFFMVDLDHFSRINEYFGASLGDQVLQLVAQSLRRIVRESDAVIRWGGEEFLVVARNTSRRHAQELAERIRTVLAGLSVESASGEILRWTVSIGFAAFPFHMGDAGWLGWERVVEITDTCLEVAKKSGRNAWVGVEAGASLDRAAHGGRIPKGLHALVDEGLLTVVSSRQDPFGKTRKTGEILG